MNYGESFAYWYLRLNGFFPIPNFVIHRTEEIENPSDCDVVAVRPPLVYEEIGGNRDDWDSKWLEHIDTGRTLGIITEVKTGGFSVGDIFQSHYVKYSIGRLGFTSAIDDIANELDGVPFIDVGENYRIIKLLVANREPRHKSFLFLNLHDILKFLLDRVGKYPVEKYQDRMFFHSVAFQGLIEIKRFMDALVSTDESDGRDGT